MPYHWAITQKGLSVEVAPICNIGVWLMESRYSSCYRGTRVLRIQHLQPSISLGLTKPETLCACVISGWVFSWAVFEQGIFSPSVFSGPAVASKSKSGAILAPYGKFLSCYPCLWFDWGSIESVGTGEGHWESALTLYFKFCSGYFRSNLVCLFLFVTWSPKKCRNH